MDDIWMIYVGDISAGNIFTLPVNNYK